MGFPIHGAIDGFSRKILWLEVTRSNNSPNKIVSHYAKKVEELGGCPAELITNLGTENGLAAALQSFFHDSPEAHRYVASQRNQRIEGWWSFYSKNHSVWWRNFFSDLEAQRIVDTSSQTNMECLWYCFNKVLQAELDFVREHWNTHTIRKSKHGTAPGRPDSIYFLPELHGTTDYIYNVSTEEIEHGLLHISTEDVDNLEVNEHEEYFEYVRNNLSIMLPTDWEEALEMDKKLSDIAIHGYHT